MPASRWLNQTDHWQLIGACLAVVAAGYSTFVLWPHRAGETRDWVVPFVFSVTVGWVLASLFVWFPGWVVNHLGGLILAVPIFIWFRSLKVRTTACFLLAFAVHDGIHVFLTRKMDEFMAPFSHTPFILYLPRDATLSTLSSLGYGDLVVPGILVVVAGRMAARKEQPWLLWGTCLGITVGFAAAFALSPYTTAGFPMLITLVPAGLLGYALGARAKQAPHIRTDPSTNASTPASALQRPETL